MEIKKRVILRREDLLQLAKDEINTIEAKIIVRWEEETDDQESGMLFDKDCWVEIEETHKNIEEEKGE